MPDIQMLLYVLHLVQTGQITPVQAMTALEIGRCYNAHLSESQENKAFDALSDSQLSLDKQNKHG